MFSTNATLPIHGRFFNAFFRFPLEVTSGEIWRQRPDPLRIQPGWGFHALRGLQHCNWRVYYPADTDGENVSFKATLTAAPIVFIVHGNHAATRLTFPVTVSSLNENVLHYLPLEPGYSLAPGRVSRTITAGHTEIPNHTGYAYLQRLLAKMGIISVSVDCNEANESTASAINIHLRALIVSASMAYFENLPTSSVLHDKIDFSQASLLGHSRGGDAVVLIPEVITSGWVASRGVTITKVKIQGVIALAPTNWGAVTKAPSGYAFMTILPAADGDVLENNGAYFYDWAKPSPFKSQIYVHGANHNFFNREWTASDAFENPPNTWGLKLLSRDDHERLLSSYACAFLRFLFFKEDTLRFLNGTTRPAGAPASSVHWSFAAPLQINGTIDDYESAALDKNSHGLSVTTVSLTVSKKSFRYVMGLPGKAGSSFYGNTQGLLAQPLKSTDGTYRSEISLIDLTNLEIWVRTAEFYDIGAAAFPSGATGFQLGIEDNSGMVAWVDCGRAGGVARPYYRKLHDEHPNPKYPGLTVCDHDATKTMLETLRFKASYFRETTPSISLDKVQAVLLKFDRHDGVGLAFDDLQIVDPSKAVI